MNQYIPPSTNDGQILNLWRSGFDTFDIAKRLGLLEWQVYNRLLHARRPHGAVASVFGSPPQGRSALDQKQREGA